MGSNNNVSPQNRKKIWIDLDNSPHVPFFKPIIDELENRGYGTVVTARDCFQVCGLADLLNVPYKRIGRHYGKNMALKAFGLAVRSLRLLYVGLRERPDLAVSHGSRSQLVAAWMLRIPSIAMDDYEHSTEVIKPTWMIMPEVIPEKSIKPGKVAVLRYPGIKEDVYVPNFEPDPKILDDLGLAEGTLLVTIRPPATEAHYHNRESDKLFVAAVDLIGLKDNARMVMLPRNEKQAAHIRKLWSDWCTNGKIVIPNHVIDGLNLIWHSDLVISGGGTMNREAAALGVPVYSIFRGEIGAVDEYLVKSGRLTLLENVEDIQAKLSIIKRAHLSGVRNVNRKALSSIVEGIIQALKANPHDKQASRDIACFK
jgi:uncharacterized protein